MSEETADSLLFITQEEPSCCDAVMSSSRGRVVKGLSGSVAGSVLFHGLLAAAVFLLPFMLPKGNIDRQVLTVSLVDSAQFGGGAGAVGAVSSSSAGRHVAGAASCTAPADKDVKAKVASAANKPDVVPKIDLPDWPKNKSKEPDHTAAGVAAKLPAAAGRHGKKHSRSRKHPVKYRKAVPGSPVRRGPKAAGDLSGDAKGAETAKIITTGIGAGAGAAEGAGGMPSEADFHRASRVDKPPEPMRKCEPVYPDKARELGISGKVVVKFLVNRAGHVSRPVVVQADPKGVFEKSALAAILKWRFKPGRFRGKPVATWVVVPFEFQLDG